MTGTDSKWNQLFMVYFSISQMMLKISIGPHSGAKTISSNILQTSFLFNQSAHRPIYAEKFS